MEEELKTLSGTTKSEEDELREMEEELKRLTESTSKQEISLEEEERQVREMEEDLKRRQAGVSPAYVAFCLLLFFSYFAEICFRPR